MEFRIDLSADGIDEEEPLDFARLLAEVTEGATGAGGVLLAVSVEAM